jgi:hypothetical protein
MIVYPLWGYGIFNVFEDPIWLRKYFHPPSYGMAFTRRNFFTGHNDNLPLPKPQSPPYREDKDGNILPTRIRRYSFADEYTFRI